MFAVMPHAKCYLNESVTKTSIPDYHTVRSAIINENTSLESSQQFEVDEPLKCNRKLYPLQISQVVIVVQYVNTVSLYCKSKVVLNVLFQEQVSIT